MNIDNIARQVSDRVAHGRPVTVRPSQRLAARELTIEFEPEPYPEVPAAFSEFCRVTDTSGRLGSYAVRSGTEDDATRAQVTVTVNVADVPRQGRAVADDVVQASVQAFAAAVGF